MRHPFTGRVSVLCETFENRGYQVMTRQKLVPKVVPVHTQKCHFRHFARFFTFASFRTFARNHTFFTFLTFWPEPGLRQA